MARDKIFDPAFQKSFTEAIKKEKKLRAQWHETSLKRVSDSCKFDDEPDDDEMPQSPTPDQPPVKPYEVEKRIEHASKEAVSQPVEDIGKILPLEIMKPVPVKTKELLYKGLSHDQEGKAKYLRKRQGLDPEEKFHFPICSSWEYGWTYGQEFALKCPDHGRREIIKASFFRNNDPQLKPRR